ncbi:anaerobic ribonucleoside-triphosphate reductase activating protein [Rarobacter faecitabidus]|uniref:Pyruvate formate lyase activating enzyme n=1 Tax=Rarobacter faecitabidus TaxID=13243 RepID=A0A542ZTE8_RARFA|nr:anaerobic ribonucleoside-triphosphate reductase activating protein [Rarobacter faecitabidus]TQL63621.1 pyruvate formate lyase activating enzyme [Rarobacter faecitabidus]
MPIADEIAIAGWSKLSTCDWPDKLVATLFLQGCPWRCTYCHNFTILDPRQPGKVAWSEVRLLLGKRRGLLDGVVFSGGEPTRQACLPAAMRHVRALGYGVGLHTGGAFPKRLAAALPYTDWVGLDIKATPDKFDQITRRQGSARPAYESLELVLAAGVDVQVRTTVDPTVLSTADVERLTALLRDEYGVTDHVLQTVRPDGTTDEYRCALAAAMSFQEPQLGLGQVVLRD